MFRNLVTILIGCCCVFGTNSQAIAEVFYFSVGKDIDKLQDGVQSTVVSGQNPYHVAGMTMDQTGNLYFGIADEPGNAYGAGVLVVTPGQQPSVIAFQNAFGNNIGYGVEGNNNGAIHDFYVNNVATDSHGNVYYATNVGNGNGTSSGQIYELYTQPDGKVASALVVSGLHVSTFADNSPNPIGMAFDASDHLYVTEPTGGQIDKFDVSSFVKDPTAGTTMTPSADNVFATVTTPNDLKFDSHGNLFASSITTGNIYEISTSGTVTTFASGLSRPMGISFDNQGNLLVANNGNDHISSVSTDGTVTDLGHFSGENNTSDLSWISGTPSFIGGEPASVPEPSSTMLLGLVAVGWYLNRRRSQSAV